MSGDFRVGEWHVQPTVNRVRRGDRVLRLEPKVMQVLVMLAEHAGEVVTREQLVSRVWPDVFVSDDVLHRAVRELRRVFGDNATDPQYIETIRKRGYRLIADISDSPELPSEQLTPGSDHVGPGFSLAAPLAPVAPLAPEALEAPERQAAKPHASWSFTALAAALALACAGVIIALAWRPSTLATEAHARFVPVVSGPANEFDPSISPDGNRVAFVIRESDTAPADVYIRDLQSGLVSRVTTDPGSDRNPVWSPDGQRLAFVRATHATCDIVVRGLERGDESPVGACGNHDDPRLAWTHDGRALVTSQAERGTAIDGWRLVRIDLASGASTPITSPPAGIVGDHSPAISPDGRTVAFIRRISGSVSDVYVAPIEGGPERRVTHDEADLMGIAWTTGGRALVYSSDRAGGYNLWRVPAEGGEPRLVAGGAARLKHPVAAQNAERVVYESWNYEINVWERGIASEATDSRAVIRTSELWNLYPQVSPDNKRLAWVSTQSGEFEIWIANRDGSSARQLTRMRAAAKMPRWSPDGRRIAFLAHVDGIDVFVVDVETGVVTRVTRDAATEVAPAWMPDGQAVLFGARRGTERWNVWSARVDGDDREAALVINDAVAAQASPDGRALYFTRPDRAGLWRQPISGGAATLMTEGVSAGDTAGWALGAEAIHIVAETSRGIVLQRIGLDGGAPVDVAPLTNFSWPGISIAPDGRVLYARWDRRESNIMSVELGSRSATP